VDVLLIIIAGVAMLLHFALCAVARRGLSGDNSQAIEEQLFVVPNRFAGTPRQFSLLRFRYYLPFRTLPLGASELESWVQTAIFAARATGLIFICASLGFFVMAFVEAGR
jgi:hypothetical protein